MQRFLYCDSVLLEVERQKSAFGHVDDWAIEFLKLTEYDVSATLMQVFSSFVKTILDFSKLLATRCNGNQIQTT